MKTQTFAKSGHELNSSSQGSVYYTFTKAKIHKGQKSQMVENNKS